jgi:ABC-type nitrate/sulfonate/bicarbonate transport system substrate-binding protein
MTTDRLSEQDLRQTQPVGLNVIAFPGASNWPFWAAQQKGFFARQRLDISLHITPNSVHMARELHAGGAQIALTSMDNVLAYARAEGEVSLNGPADFFAFMSVDDGLLSLMAQPNFKDVTHLRGQRLAVDALTTGYAFVLKEILAHHGLAESDVGYVSVGTGMERLSALNERLCAATLLNAPLCLAAESVGKIRLVRASTVLGAYQGVVAAARRSWARGHQTVIHAFMRGYEASIRWLCDPENADEARSLLIERLPSLQTVVDDAYRVLITERGLDRTLRLQHEAVETVMKLREKHGSCSKEPAPADDHIDDEFWRAVFGEGDIGSTVRR